MKLAVMQPYLFPYIGYFQLIYAADIFLLYDDVSFIKQGFINRNKIASKNGVVRFTLPVPGASSNKLISDLEFSSDVSKLLKTLEQSYSKAPYYEPVFPMIREVLENEDRSIAAVCQKSYEAIFSYLGLDKDFKKTSELDYDRTASARDRLIALSYKFNADCYINLPGGKSLYSKSYFSDQGVDLKFIESLSVVGCQQGERDFTPDLSIIDLLMNCSPYKVLNIIKKYNIE